ncbi:MAG: hypothetical protein E5V86_16360 [Mesorhizobium sp.]|nr:MAG: hypothetical protein E5W03_05545 [Mesorhizobium sp.]TIV21969.1 MAG: hypothetical protein E5W02_09730 [Mesorhizobium sp.]TIV64157.1 MAG: hypothetical protein E5V86_16360 [Mesorhizobium sp.]
MAIGSISPSKKRFDRRRRQGVERPRAVLSPATASPQTQSGKGRPAMDLIVLGIGILFFALSLAYVKACDRI